MDFCFLQLDLIMMSETGFASSTEILNLADQLKPKKMKKREAEQVLQSLVRGQWLAEVTDGWAGDPSPTQGTGWATRMVPHGLHSPPAEGR